ncbi:MAG: peptidase prolyl oligopeptidase active site domain protein, partial [Actinomycetia bacterium]|nr:peptidase prolyl oligopeptidase active site domain protein [Actinomycetes bacterium]
GVPRAATISRDGERVVFLRTGGGEDPVTRLWLLNLADGRGEELLADPAATWNADRGEVPEAERVRRERVRERAAGIVAYSADVDCRTVAFALDGQLWVLRVGGGIAGDTAAVPTLVPAAGPVIEPRIDPTGQRVAYVTDGALHVVELDGGADRLLAAPEHADVTYGLAEHVAAESMSRYRGFWWAPDGRQLLVARVDNSPVLRWWIADPANPQRPPRAIRYPAAGTPNAEVTLHVLRLDGTRTEVSWDRNAFEYLATADWDAHGPLVSVQSRDQRTVLILAADPVTGVTRVLHEERDPAWVHLTYGAPLRTEAGRLVHVSDLDGARRLVVGSTPVTPDGLQVREVSGADGETVYFTGTQDPTEGHLWRYDPERGLCRLSDSPGVHGGSAAGGTVVQFSHTEAGHAVTATPSDMARSAGSTTARSAITPAMIACLAAEPVLKPRITWLTVGARELRTALLLPSWYQPGTRLPVLMSPYGGPAGQRVVRVRSSAFCEEQWFAEHGFAVLVTDGRGTPGRGPAWEKTVYGDTLSGPVDDQVDALMSVSEQFQDLDLSKVGIRGWSYGGALAAMAVIRRPDVFHAAISGAAPHDQRLYDTHWRERFLGTPDENPTGYDHCSTMTQAANLTRPLLLIHGMADDNVVAAHTLRISSALLAAGRPHQVLPLSGSTHMPTDENTVSQLLRHQLAFLADALDACRQGD